MMLAVSLDGFIEGPNGEYDWCLTDQDYGMNAFFQRADTVFFGRKSYELFLREGQDWMPPMKHYVFSNSMHKAPEGALLVGGNLKQAVEQIKNERGKDIWMFGGASLIESFMNEGLIDELILAVHPILLGGGKPLFHGIKDRIQLELVSSKQYDTGLVSVHYTLKK